MIDHPAIVQFTTDGKASFPVLSFKDAKESADEGIPLLLRKEEQEILFLLLQMAQQLILELVLLNPTFQTPIQL